jgi:hypothetical protein
MIEVRVTDEMRGAAVNAASRIKHMHNSITKLDGLPAGYLGEYIVAEHYGAQLWNTQDYDLVFPDGTKVDVKTKRRTVVPKLSYEGSVSDFNTSQKCDIYVFVSVMKNLSRGWIMGYYPRDEYYEVATFLRKGSIDPSNGFRVRADCHNVPYSILRQWEENATV